MKIGIFGGTFDPPHIGHINVFKAFVSQFDFDNVFVIPVFVPPHKSLKSDVSVEHRLNMTRLAFEHLSSKAVVSDLEIKRQGRSYTADTIRYFKENGYDDIYFLCGTDMLLTLDSWYKPDYIFKNATIVYARRENEADIDLEISRKISLYEEKFGAKIVKLNCNVLEISSSEIRASLKDNSKCDYLTEEIEKYIRKHMLYCDW